MAHKFVLSEADFVRSLMNYFTVRDVRKLKNIGKTSTERGEKSFLDWQTSHPIVEQFKNFLSGVMSNASTSAIVQDSVMRAFSLSSDESFKLLTYAVPDDEWSLCVSPCLLCSTFQFAAKSQGITVEPSHEQLGNMFYIHTKLVQRQIHFAKNGDLIRIFSSALSAVVEPEVGEDQPDQDIRPTTPIPTAPYEDEPLPKRQRKSKKSKGAEIAHDVKKNSPQPSYNCVSPDYVPVTTNEDTEIADDLEAMYTKNTSTAKTDTYVSPLPETYGNDDIVSFFIDEYDIME